MGRATVRLPGFGCMVIPMHCLVLSDTFPNRVEPERGPYNRRQMECLSKHCRLTVINPLPWHQTLPGRRWHALPPGPHDVLDGIALFHPRLWHVPVLGRNHSWRAVLAAARRVLRSASVGACDVVMATFAYPHGPAAIRLAEELGVPCVLKVRGSDLHSLPFQSARGRRTAEALAAAAAVVAVSGNLASIARELGAPADRVHVLPNGVDVDRFVPVPREDARRELGVAADWDGIVLFVGSLLPVKRVDVLIDAMAIRRHEQPSDRCLLAIAGRGLLRRRLQRQAARLGVGDAVKLLGHIPQQRVALWMNAADMLVLPSEKEGCPNVVLEALSCGTPVVASRVGAVPDLLDQSCGLVVQPGEAGALALAMREAAGRRWDRSALRQRASGMSWDANAARLHSILSSVVSAYAAPEGLSAAVDLAEARGHERS